MQRVWDCGCKMAPVSGLKAVVLGGGAIGVGAALCLRAMGVEDITVIEVNPLRLETLHRYCRFSSQLMAKMCMRLLPAALTW